MPFLLIPYQALGIALLWAEGRLLGRLLGRRPPESLLPLSVLIFALIAGLLIGNPLLILGYSLSAFVVVAVAARMLARPLGTGEGAALTIGYACVFSTVLALL
jgi:hypothetical protein